VRSDNDGLAIYSGRFRVGQAHRYDTGPRPYWAWGVAIATASGTCHRQDDVLPQIGAVWHAWLERAGLAGSARPLRVVLACGAGLTTADPDKRVVYSGSIVIGTLRRDQWRNMDPRIIRPPVAPWSWLLDQRYRTDAMGKVWGGVSSMADGLAAITAAWGRWLDFAELTPLAQSKRG
jgi:hypothetical protein